VKKVKNIPFFFSSVGPIFIHEMIGWFIRLLVW
jgi:hypothetical protein